ncbi:hypothetical protein AB6A40_004482 [Gnathostoma spinigerum]|uniref:Uncharacterized protein n=1 Tax=Gnathostoma spinigerum TaxID=75299 RepID=A0ABD6ELC9_9BILA
MMSDDGLQHSQSSHSLHHREQQQQQFQQAHSTLPSQQQHTLSSTGAAELLLQQQLGTQLRASTLGLAKVPQSKTAVTTSSITHNAPDTSAKPVATVVPISVPTTVNLANLKNAKNSAAVILSQHSSLANMASMFGGVIQNASKDATMSSCTMQSASTTTTATSAVVKKGKSDSRWSCIDERVLFLAGPKFKTHRKKTVTRRLSRSIALHPCRNNDFINKNLPSLQLFFR